MSKAVLVIDMPTECCVCRFNQHTDRCHAIKPAGYCNAYRHVGGLKGRPNWCPLVPIPEKVTEPIDSEDVGKDYSEGTMDGWNAAIDAIGGNDSDGK